MPAMKSVVRHTISGNSFDAMYYAFHIELWYTPKITWFAYT